MADAQVELCLVFDVVRPLKVAEESVSPVRWNATARIADANRQLSGMFRRVTAYHDFALFRKPTGINNQFVDDQLYQMAVTIQKKLITQFTTEMQLDGTTMVDTRHVRLQTAPADAIRAERL